MSTQTGRKRIKAYVRRNVRHTWRSSWSCTTRVTKISSGCSFKSRAAWRMVRSIVASAIRLSSTEGKRSPRRAKKTGTSSDTKRGRLASRRAPVIHQNYSKIFIKSY